MLSYELASEIFFLLSSQSEKKYKIYKYILNLKKLFKDYVKKYENSHMKIILLTYCLI